MGKVVFYTLLAPVWPDPVTLSQLSTNIQVNADHEPYTWSQGSYTGSQRFCSCFTKKKILFFPNGSKKSDKHYPLLIRKSTGNEKFTKSHRVFFTGF